MPQFKYKLYLVTDEEACRGRDLLWVIEEAILGGVEVVQLREKNLTEMAFLKKAGKLKDLLAKYQVPLIINDSVLVATAINAAGIHVGTNDMSPSTIRQNWPKCQLLGYSIESLQQLETVETAVSDYLAISPVFATTTKKDTIVEWGIEGIKKIRALTDKPLVAIGGITTENAAEIIQAGADCLAIVSAICSADSPRKAAAQFKQILQTKKR